MAAAAIIGTGFWQTATAASGRCRSFGPAPDGRPRSAGLRRAESLVGPKELQQIVSQAHDRPLAGSLTIASEREAPKPSRLFGLPEYGLHDGLARGGDRRPGRGGELRAHHRRPRASAFIPPAGLDPSVDAF